MMSVFCSLENVLLKQDWRWLCFIHCVVGNKLCVCCGAALKGVNMSMWDCCTAPKRQIKSCRFYSGNLYKLVSDQGARGCLDISIMKKQVQQVDASLGQSTHHNHSFIRCWHLFKYLCTQITEIKEDIACKNVHLPISPPFSFQPWAVFSCDDFSSSEWSLTFSSPNSVWPTSIGLKQKSSTWKTVRRPGFFQNHIFFSYEILMFV